MKEITSFGDSYKSFYVYSLMITVAMGPLYWGYSAGVISPTQEYLMKKVFPSEPASILYLSVAIRNIGAILGGGLGGQLASHLGRRKALMLSDILGVVSSLLSVVPNIWVLLVSRILNGIYTGLNCVVVPLYIGETSPPEIKGKTGTYTSLFDTVGVLIGYLLGLGMPSILDEDASYYWQIMFILGGLIPLLRYLLLSKIFQHDTPIFLLTNNKVEEAQKAYHLIYQQERANEEFHTTFRSIELLGKDSKKNVSTTELFTRRYRMALFVGCFLNFQIQFTGFQYITFYATSIFKMAAKGPEDNSPQLFTIILGLSAVITSYFAGNVVQKHGRKLVLIAGQVSMALALVLFMMVCASNPTSPFLTYLVILGFIFYFLTLGPVKWVYLAEILPAKGLAVGQIVNFTGGFLTTQVAPMINDSFGPVVTFGMFLVSCIVGFLFVKYIVIETKGMSHFETLMIYSPPEEPVEIEDRENASPVRRKGTKLSPTVIADMKMKSQVMMWLNQRMSVYGERIYVPDMLPVVLEAQKDRSKSVFTPYKHAGSIYIEMKDFRRNTAFADFVHVNQDTRSSSISLLSPQKKSIALDKVMSQAMRTIPMVTERENERHSINIENPDVPYQQIDD